MTSKMTITIENCSKTLNRCGISVANMALNREVFSCNCGNFRISKWSYYWAVKGKVPLNAAKELYNNPVGRTDIRVAGHCCCPPPEMPWVDCYMIDGRKVLHSREKAECEKLATCSTTSLADIAKKILSESVFSDDPISNSDKQFVESYHIDSELGLYIFFETLKRYNLV